MSQEVPSLQDVLREYAARKGIVFPAERRIKERVTFGDTGLWYAAYNDKMQGGAVEQYCRFGLKGMNAELEMLMIYFTKNESPDLRADIFTRNPAVPRESLLAKLHPKQRKVIEKLQNIMRIISEHRPLSAESLELSVDAYTDAILLARRILP